MKALTLLQASEMRVKLRELEKSLPTLSLFERCDAEDEILELKEALGEFERKVLEAGDDCENCSG